MFNYRKYQQGGYNRYTYSGKAQKQFRKDEENEVVPKKSIKKTPFTHDMVIIGSKYKSFYKSRKRKMKRRKTVRFAENLEENFHAVAPVIKDNDRETNDQEITDEKKYDWDISIDFEELI